MPIRSPYNSFVDFNSEIEDCKGNTRQARLPVIDHFGIMFQIKVEDQLLDFSEDLYAGVVDANCTSVEYDPDEQVIPTCPRWKFMGSDSMAITESLFPILVEDYAPLPGQPQITEGTYSYSDFLNAISSTYGIQLDSYDFYDCCELPTISGIVVYYNGTGDSKQISLNKYWGYGYVDFPAHEISEIDPGNCFRYAILDEDKNILSCSNLFYVETEECYTSVLTYYNEENGYGFRYVVYEDEGTDKVTQNKIRLPFYLRRPTFQIEENIIRRSDGVKQRTSTTIEKQWSGVVGYLSPEQHEKLLIALKHDWVKVENTYSGVNQRMTQEGDYSIGYPDELNTVLSPAEFTITDYKHNNVNNNCGFNCGVEFVEACGGGTGGGNANPCPEKYMIEFVVGGAEMADGDTKYQDDNLLNKTGVEVYREGLYQHTTGINNAVYNPSTGEITFTPAVSAGPPGERISIIEI